MKPETCVIVGVLVYFAAISLNHFLGERNYRTLTQEDKLKMIDAFSKHRSLSTYLPIGIMLVVLGIVYLNPSSFVFVLPIGVVLVLAAMLAIQLSIFRRLSELTLPADFVRNFRVQSILVQLGNLVAMCLLVYGTVGRYL